MRVRYASYPTAFITPGGGEIQLLKTLGSVADHGLDVDYFNFFNPFEKGPIDILHVFTVYNSIELYAKVCKELKICFIVSPILWPTNYDEAERNRIRYILTSADAILPNSLVEKNRIIESLDIVDHGQFFIIPNGIDVAVFRKAKRLNELVCPNQVLCIANVDSRKNLHILLQSCRNLGLKLTLFGSVRDRDYFNGLVKNFSEVLEYKGTFQHGTEEHISILQSARVFALASTYETPGLAAIEAGASGVPIVVTEVGSAAEYFGDYADYCDPESVDSVTEAIRRSMQRPSVLSDMARNHFASFSWERAAQATIHAYRDIKFIDAATLCSRVGVAVGGSRVVDPATCHEPGLLTYGPYYIYKPGRYSITVEYNSPASLNELVSQFEVFNSNSDLQIFASDMRGTNNNSAALTFYVDFDLTNSAKIEFRIFWLGRFKLIVDRIRTEYLT